MRASLGCVVLFVALVGCGDNNPQDVDAPLGPPCSDGADNDGDGQTDFPDDLGCESTDDETEDSLPKPQCADNRDNDGDGKADFPNDPGCPVPQADDELDPCPNGSACPQCADTKDNDGNGIIDFPNDPGCASAADLIEFTDNPNACGQGMVIKQLPNNGQDMGGLIGSTSMVSSPCGGGNGLPAVAYVFHLTTPRVIVASTDDPMTAIDTILDLRTSMCTGAAAELACHDDIQPTGITPNRKSKITRSLRAGSYYLIVGGKTATDTGTYVLRVDQFPGEGTPCTTVDDCGPTLECRIPMGQTQLVCAGPVCADGVDDDSDGKIDYPIDPGCATPSDSTENDVCIATPLDPMCPQCGNGIDDDMDGQSDYPNDTACVAASTVNEACPQSEPFIVATTPQTMSTTLGMTNDYTPPPGNFNNHLCSTTSTHLAPDRVIQLDLPPTNGLTLALNPVSYDSTHILFDASCGGTPIDCSDNPTNMVVNNLAGGRYYLIVDGYSSGAGNFTLNVTGTIRNGESCESALAQSGALTCAPGYACLGTAGSRTCTRTQCNDMMDNNGNGRMDFPNDPGCQNVNDPIEDTVCPGASCPACADGVDNDMDTQIDYPADTGCLSAAAVNEGCPESDPIAAIAQPTTMGTLVGATDDHNPSCVASNFADRVYTLQIPTTLQSLVIDTRGSVVDTVLSLMSATCAEPSIACDDDAAGSGDSQITRGTTSAGLYTIAVDADVAALDTFVLNVRGTIVPGGSCEGALFANGVLACPANFGCNGPMGSRTCTAAQCLDGVDNNGDGRTDYPNDPSCTSSSDNSEVTVCPGASCPVCSDGADNDMDGRTDYPADTGCIAASGTNEGCTDTDAITPILMPVTNGTLVGATDDHQPACVALPGADVIHTLAVPQLESLTIDTEGSTVDTVLSFMTSDCREPALACDDDGGLGVGDSLITRSTVTAGTYTIAVDARSTTSSTYTLNVSGVISPGQSCESPLVATGVLRCSLGFACDGPMGMRTCSLAQCIDGQDNNSDGRTDFPADPGCSSFSDDTETTVCPGASCPLCSDGVDNDMDGATDYPMDASCFAASANNEACTQSEPVLAITSRVTTGNTASQVNDYTPTCGSTTGHSAPDAAYELVLPAMAILNLDLSGFDTVHTLLDATCGGTPIVCSDPQLITRTSVPAGTYYVVIDGYSSGSGPWSLTTTGTVEVGGSCEGVLFQSGAFTCTDGYVCAGTLGSRVCTAALCSNTTDDDGDGKTDYPADPGCTSISDNSETDDCSPTVGPNCPACGNGLDDDSDTMTDYPNDPRCPSASFFVENFCAMEANIAGMIVTPSTTGSLALAANNFSQACQANTGNDVSYGLRLPVAVGSLQIDTIGSVAGDTVVSLWDVTCTNTLGCDDDGDPLGNRSLLTVTSVPAGDYAIQVDSFGASNNLGITLNVVGTVAPGTACTHPHFASGVLVCPTGTSCTAGTCQ
jgi:hypothetical protein